MLNMYAYAIAITDNNICFLSFIISKVTIITFIVKTCLLSNVTC